MTHHHNNNNKSTEDVKEQMDDYQKYLKDTYDNWNEYVDAWRNAIVNCAYNWQNFMVAPWMIYGAYLKTINNYVTSVKEAYNKSKDKEQQQQQEEEKNV